MYKHKADRTKSSGSGLTLKYLNNMSHGQNMSPNSGKAELCKQYFFKNMHEGLLGIYVALK
jgi:hypothetical protein